MARRSQRLVKQNFALAFTYNALTVLLAVLGLLGLAALLWALRSGQYDDLDGAAQRILFDDDDGDEQARGKKPLGKAGVIFRHARSFSLWTSRDHLSHSPMPAGADWGADFGGGLGLNAGRRPA